jgi:hypothetical protein
MPRKTDEHGDASRVQSNDGCHPPHHCASGSHEPRDGDEPTVSTTRISKLGGTMDTLWTLQDLATFLRITLGAARKIVSRGQLPAEAVVRIGRRIRIRSAIVQRWLQKEAA